MKIEWPKASGKEIYVDAKGEQELRTWKKAFESGEVERSEYVAFVTMLLDIYATGGGLMAQPSIQDGNLPVRGTPRTYDQIVIPDFDGKTYDANLDKHRLFQQLMTVADIVKDEQWHTLSELSERTGFPESSVSARLRDFRKLKFGGHRVERQRAENGLHHYRLVVNPDTAVPLGYGDQSISE